MRAPKWRHGGSQVLCVVLKSFLGVAKEPMGGEGGGSRGGLSGGADWFDRHSLPTAEATLNFIHFHPVMAGLVDRAIELEVVFGSALPCGTSHRRFRWRG